MGNGLGSSSEFEWSLFCCVRWLDYGARFYNPSIGRWTSVDALADHPYQADKSPYAYAWNDPINLTDPDGNCPSCVIGGLVSAAVDLGIQVAQNKLNGKGAFENINGTSIGASFIGGFASGGISTLTKVGTLAKAGLNVTVDVGESLTNQAIEGDVSVGKTITDLGASRLGGLVNAKGIDTKQLEGNATRKINTALKSDKPSKVKNAIAAESRLNTANNINRGLNVGAQKTVEGVTQNVGDAVRGILNTGSPNNRTNVIQPIRVARDNTRVVIPIIRSRSIRL